MQNIVVFGSISAVLLVSLFGIASMTGMHHIPAEQMAATTTIVRGVYCTTPEGERLDVGHCWFSERQQQWYWCRPKLADRNTGKRLIDSAVDKDFEPVIMSSMYTITGIDFVRAQAGRCVSYEGKDVYR